MSLWKSLQCGGKHLIARGYLFLHFTLTFFFTKENFVVQTKHQKASNHKQKNGKIHNENTICCCNIHSKQSLILDLLKRGRQSWEVATKTRNLPARSPCVGEKEKIGANLRTVLQKRNFSLCQNGDEIEDEDEIARQFARI